MNIKKRDGTIVPFNRDKIHNAVYRALEAIGLPSESTADKVTDDVVGMLGQRESISVEEVQDLVEVALMKRGLNAAAKAYILYRDAHARARKSIHVRKRSGSRQSVTDKSMLISEVQDEQVSDWDRTALERRVVDAGIPEDAAKQVGKKVEECIINSGLQEVSNSLVREMTNNVLRSMGYAVQLKDASVYAVPVDFVKGLIESKVNENSNIQANNPEAVSQSISEFVLKKFAFNEVFDYTVRQAHNEGLIYVHDAGFPTRGYAFSGEGTTVIAKVAGVLNVYTLKQLWDLSPAPEERLNETQVRKACTELQVLDRGQWVVVEQLVLSKEVKAARRFQLDGDCVQAVTDEHGVVVFRDGKYVIVRADEVQLSDKLVRM